MQKPKKRLFTSEATRKFSGVQPVRVLAGNTLGIGGVTQEKASFLAKLTPVIYINLQKLTKTYKKLFILLKTHK